MASILSAIRTQMLADADDTTSIVAASEGPLSVPPSANQMPYAELIWGPEETEYQYFNARTVKRALSIAIHAPDREGVDLAAEDLANLWETGSKRTTLQALGVIDVRCETDEPSFTNEDDSHHIGVIQLTVEYRVTIAAPA